jgi:hypothetical protein
MTTILIAGLSFVVGAVAAGVALLAFAAWSTRDLKEVEGNSSPGRPNAPQKEELS